MANHTEDVRRTRSGRPINRNDTPHENASRTPSPKKRVRKANKSGKPIPELPGPLSLITAGMNVPVRDMKAWVHRPVSERLAETEKKKGYVSRPMNSFMLYRSAYSERTKAWCTANNHQVVSSVSGVSWPMESESLRQFYTELAKIERTNHAAAHPSYKFAPAKPGQRKRKGTHDSDDESADNVSLDPDADWASSHRARSKSRSRRENSQAAVVRPHAGSPPMPKYVHSHNQVEDRAYITMEQPQTIYHRTGPIQSALSSRHHVYASQPELHNHAQYWVQQGQLHYQPQAMPMRSIPNLRYQEPQDALSLDGSNNGYAALPGGINHDFGQMPHHMNPAPLEVLEPPAGTVDPGLMPLDEAPSLSYHDQYAFQAYSRAEDRQARYHNHPHFESPRHETAIIGSNGLPSPAEPAVSQQGKYRRKEWVPDTSEPMQEPVDDFEKYFEDGFDVGRDDEYTGLFEEPFAGHSSPLGDRLP